MNPDSLLDSVRAERTKYGTPLRNAEMGALINAVAWKHRADGWGLAAKSTGAHTTQPGTGTKISRDLLVHEPTEQMYDVLIDVAGKANPSWLGPMPQDLPFVKAVLPVGAPRPPDVGDIFDALREHLREIDAHTRAALEILG